LGYSADRRLKNVFSAAGLLSNDINMSSLAPTAGIQVRKESLLEHMSGFCDIRQSVR